MAELHEFEQEPPMVRGCQRHICIATYATVYSELLSLLWTHHSLTLGLNVLARVEGRADPFHSQFRPQQQ
jgi:hypothetical protein